MINLSGDWLVDEILSGIITGIFGTEFIVGVSRIESDALIV